MGMLRMRDWAGAFPFDLLASSFCSSISLPCPVLLCPALPACLSACLLWELELPGWKRARDQLASGAFRSSAGHGRRVQRQPPRVPVAARAGMKNWESSGYKRHARGTGLGLFG